jgi:hypothetical protein
MTYGYYPLKGPNMSKILMSLCISIDFHSCEHPYTKSLSYTTIDAAHRGAHEIHLCEIDGI